MQSMVDVVVGKYMRPAQATEFMEYLLRLALYDLEEAWMDECTSLLQRLQDSETSHTVVSESLKILQQTKDSLLVQNDALEAEIIRLKGQMQAQEQAVKAAKTRDDLLRLYNTEAP